MHLNEYMQFTEETAIYGESVHRVTDKLDPAYNPAENLDNLEDWLKLNYVVTKLNGEAGEIAEHLGKSLRDDGCAITTERRDKLVAELGDLMYYAARLAIELNTTLELVCTANMEKLRSRKARGVIGGSGSDR